jgi:asparagine synthase (glutamine-hydrolysing)
MLEKMNNQGFKVGLLGTAADEIFAGYYDHYLLHLHSIKDQKFFEKEKNNFLKYIQKYIRNDLLRDPEKYMKNRFSREHIFDESKILKSFFLVKNNTKFKEKKFAEDLFRNRMLNELFSEITPVILNEDDLNSMNYSIENRSPYLDKNLVEFVYSLPSSYLIKKGYSKYLLREAFEGILNENIRLDRKKVGFNSSIDSIFNIENKKMKNFLFDKKSEIYDLVDRKKIIELFQTKSKPNYLSKFLFNFINAKIFLDIENKNYVSN